MKFPENRTEIMDHVASFASDAKLSNKEKEPLIRLALMHWNHVPDQSIPTVAYEGFDLDWVSPVKQLNLSDLIDGASDYVDERCESLNKELFIVSKQLLELERSHPSENEGHGIISKINDLYREKARIVDRLGAFGYQVINRSIDFNIEDRLLNTDKLKSILNKFINKDNDFEVGVDMGMQSHRDSYSLILYANDELVDDLVSKVSSLLSDAGLSKYDIDITIRDYNPSMPNFKHTGDQALMEKKKAKLQKEMNSESFEPR